MNQNENPVPRVLLLAYYYLPDNGSGVQRAARIARYLPEFGTPVRVIGSSHSGVNPDSSVRSVPNPASPKASADRWSRLLAFIERRILPYNEKLPWVAHAVSAAAEEIRQKRVDVIISTSPPLACHLSALWLKLRYGVRWVADFRDPLIDNPFRDRGWAKPYDRLLEYLIFRFADAVIGVTDVVVENWRKRYPRWAGKIHEIWNGYDPAEPITAGPLPVRQRRILSHVGHLYGGRRVDSVLGAILRLIGRGELDADRVSVRFIGGVDDTTVPKADPVVLKLTELRCLDYAGEKPRWEAIQLAGESDYLLLVDTNARNIGYTVPAKIFEYVRLGRPILAMTSPGSPVEKILSQAGIPYECIYPQSDDDAADEAVRRFFRYPADAVEPSAAFQRQFDGRRQAGQIAEICRAVCQISGR